MEIVNVVPQSITSALDSLRPSHHPMGGAFKDEHWRSYFPADYMKKLYWAYQSEFGIPALFIPKMYTLMYRIVLKVPTLKQMVSVLNHDAGLQRACNFVGYYKSGHINRPNNRIPSRHYKNLTTPITLANMHNNLLYLSREYKEALHNLADELDYKKVTFKGLVPSVWVEYYRKPRLRIPKIHEDIISEDDFSAICASNTGIAVIDDVTRHISSDIRLDVRQDAALACLELGISTLAEDDIVVIVEKIKRKYINDSFKKRYQERSLFSKPFKDSNTELWEMIADPSVDFVNNLEETGSND